jgi:hypothetical protein
MTQTCWYCSHESDERNNICPLCRRAITKDESGINSPSPVSNQPQTMGATDSSPYRVGYTTVKVFRKDFNEQTRKETTRQIHEGIVVDRNSLMVRVFNPAPQDKGGDISPEMSQMFPITSARCWCEVTGQRTKQYPIPATLQ